MSTENLVTSLVKIGSDEAQKTQMGLPFPLVLEPTTQGTNFIQLQEYFISHHKHIMKAASEYGAVMFKGFDLRSGEEWSSVLNESGMQETEYIGGAAVRNLIVGNEQRMNNQQILTTNESPSTEPIPFHHELAQTANPPSHITFFCKENQAKGGTTPMIRSDMVWNYLVEKHPEFAKKIEEQGVKYVKIAPAENDAGSALGRSWKAMYNVKTKEEAEASMKQVNTTWEWLDEDCCKVISPVLPAVRVSSNGNKTFYNQVVAAYTGWVDKRNKLKQGVVFGDGSFLPDDVLMDLVKYMESNRMASEWTSGKFIIVDNSVAYHSREPFHGGKRIIFAAIGQGEKQVTDKQTHVVLSSGDKMPSVGLGLWKVPGDKSADIVYDAIKAGYRLLDCAADYGNEAECGQGLKRAIDEGLVKREDVFITGKLWNTFHRKEHVREGCLKTMKDLGVDYLDLYHIHFPIALKYVPISERYPPEWMYSDEKNPTPAMTEDVGVSYKETWQAMEELVKEGLVRNIGACNLGVSMLREVLCYAKVRPACLQVELHPRLSQSKLLRWCRENSIAVTGFSNLCSASYVELSMATKEETLLENATINEIAKVHGVTAAQVILRWGVQRGTAIIPKSVNPERLRTNINLFHFNLSQEEMEKINGLNENKHYNDPGHFCEVAMGLFFPIYE